jgi:hypothetical protein
LQARLILEIGVDANFSSPGEIIIQPVDILPELGVAGDDDGCSIPLLVEPEQHEIRTIERL